MAFSHKKSSIIAIWKRPKPLWYICFSIKGIRNNNYWSIFDVIENRTTPLAFTCSKSTIETLVIKTKNDVIDCVLFSRQWRRFGVFIVNFEHISHPALMCLLLTLNKQMVAEINIYDAKVQLKALFSSLLVFKGNHSLFLKVKKNKTKALSKHSKQFLLLFKIFWFKGLSFKIQFKIEFRPPVNGGQLGLE